MDGRTEAFPIIPSPLHGRGLNQTMSVWQCQFSFKVNFRDHLISFRNEHWLGASYSYICPLGDDNNYSYFILNFN